MYTFDSFESFCWFGALSLFHLGAYKCCQPARSFLSRWTSLPIIFRIARMLLTMFFFVFVFFYLVMCAVSLLTIWPERCSLNVYVRMFSGLVTIINLKRRYSQAYPSINAQIKCYLISFENWLGTRFVESLFKWITMFGLGFI